MLSKVNLIISNFVMSSENILSSIVTAKFDNSEYVISRTGGVFYFSQQYPLLGK